MSMSSSSKISQLLSDWITAIENTDIIKAKSLLSMEPELLWTPIRHDQDVAHLEHTLSELGYLGSQFQPLAAVQFSLLYFYKHRDIRFISFLIKQSTLYDLDTRSWGQCNNTTLHLACFLGHQSIVDILLEKGVSTQTPNDLGYLPQDVNPQIQLKKLVRPNYSTPNQFKLLKQKALLADDTSAMSSLDRKASEQQYFKKGRVKETQMKVLSEEEQIVADQKKRQLEVAQLAKKSAVKNNPLYQKLEKVSTIKRRPVNQVPCTTTTSNNSSRSFDNDALENNTPKIDTITLITKTTNDDTTTTTTTTIVHDDTPDDTLDNIKSDDIHDDTTNDMHNYAKDIDSDIDVFDNYVNDIENDVNNSDSDANGIHDNTNGIDNDANDTNSDTNNTDNDTNAIDNNANVIDKSVNIIDNDANDINNDANIIDSDKDDIHNSTNDTGIIITEETQKESKGENTKDFNKEDSLVSTSDDDDDDEDEGVQYKALTAARILTAPIYKKSDEIKSISPIDIKFSTSTTLTSSYLISDEAIPRETKRRSGSQKAAWSMSMSSWAAILDREFNLNELDAERKARQDSLKIESEKMECENVESEEVESEEAPYEKVEPEEVENEKAESEVEKMFIFFIKELKKKKRREGHTCLCGILNT
ncbi:hypothetical protein RMATCC62417_17765 [Rhizopus microsporus]|nr:hypothetical protein RMATCC62417_17765 [Rhizopus microsporus]